VRVVGHRVMLTKAHMELMRIPRRFWEVSVERVPESIRQRILNYIRDIDGNLDRGEGLLLWGKNGVGKTSVAIFIAMEARRRGAPVLFSTAESLRSSVLDKTPFNATLSLMDRARYVDVLVIDDLGKEHPGETGFTERLFENLFRERSAARKTTFVTTNMDLDKMSERYKPSMLEVMKETVYPIQAKGESQRDDTPDAIRTRLATG